MFALQEPCQKLFAFPLQEPFKELLYVAEAQTFRTKISLAWKHIGTKGTRPNLAVALMLYFLVPVLELLFSWEPETSELVAVLLAKITHVAYILVCLIRKNTVFIGNYLLKQASLYLT